MAFIDCLQGKVNEGLLTKGQLVKLEAQYNSLLERYRNTMSNEDAAAQAAADVVSVEASVLAAKKRNEINGALAQERITKQLDESTTDKISYDRNVKDLLERSQVRKQSIMKQYLTSLDTFVEQFRSKFAGIYRRSDGMKRVVQELLGKGTDDAEARQFASAIKQVWDQAHARYRNAGGIIGRLDNYFPQVHKFELVRGVSFEQWYNFIRPRLDIDKMVDFETGLPFSEEKLLRLAKDDYEAIVTQGKSDLQKRAAEGKQTLGFGGEISQRKQSSRFYHFKDADSFLEYNERFGVGEKGLFDAIINNMEAFARDTAILETLGPRPNALMRHLDLQMTARGVSKANRSWAQGMYEVLTGFVDSSVGESWWFRASASLRNLFSSAYLGTAPISALADAAYTAGTAKLNGLGATKTLGRYLKLLNPASASDRKLAKKSGYIAEIARGSALADVRFTGENMGGKFTAWFAQFTNRASGLHAMTKAAADAISLEMESVIADLVDSGTSWAKIDPLLRSNLEAHDITARDWEIISQAERFEPEAGIRFLRSQEVSLVPGVDRVEALNAATKLDDVIHTLRTLATNEPPLRTRAITTGAFAGDARRGTFLRTLVASPLQFKSFPITVMFNHLIPAIRNISTGFRGDFKKARIQHAAFVFLGTTVLGGLALQLKAIVKGRDPRDMNDWRFWGASMMQGGGLGLYGDFLFQDYSRGGQNLAEALAGPTVGFVSDFLRSFNGNLNRALDDKTGRSWDKMKRDLFLFAKRNTPANTLWYDRLILERHIFDTLERAIDPEFDARVRRMERRFLKETGQRFYWRKGELAPQRAPEISQSPRR